MDNQNQFVTPQNIMPPPTPSTPIIEQKPKMRLWKKILLFLIIIIVLGITALYNIPRILTILYPNDAILVDNSNLLLQKVTMSDTDNGFYDLNKITDDMLKIPKNSQGVAFNSEYSDFTKPVQWDQKLVDQVLKDNEQVLSLLDQASSKNYFQVPTFADPANININAEFPKMNNWRTVAQLQAIKSVDLALKGKSDQALQEATKINKLGHNIISGQNSLIGTLVGVAIKSMGAKTILYILPNNNSKKEILASVINYLNNSGDDLEGYKKAFRFEYMNVISGIDQIKDNLQEAVKQVDPANAKYANFGYYFKLNQTKNLFTDFYNVPVSTIGIKCQVDDSFLGQLKSDTEKLTGWRVIFTENAVGKILSAVNLSSLTGVVTKQCQTDFISNVTKIELALKQYKIDHKTLPTSLNDLVTTYLTSIPLDPFDHQTIRYSANKKILYSVGLNQKDLGGSTGDDYTKMDNPTIKIEL